MLSSHSKTFVQRATSSGVRKFVLNPTHPDDLSRFQSNRCHQTKWHAALLIFCWDELVRLPNTLLVLTIVLETYRATIGPDYVRWSYMLLFPMFVSFSIRVHEEWRIHRKARALNTRPYTIVVKPFPHLCVARRQDLLVGQIVLVMRNDEIPADCILLATSHADGRAYFSSEAVTGSEDLQLRVAVKETRSDVTEAVMANLAGSVICSPPCPRPDVFTGGLRLKAHPRTAHLDRRNFIMEGNILRRTQWVFCLIVFTGSDTKNGRQIPKSLQRRSRRIMLEHTNNRLGMITNAVVFVIAMACAITAFVIEQRGHPFTTHLGRGIPRTFLGTLNHFVVVYSSAVCPLMLCISDLIEFCTARKAERSLRRDADENLSTEDIPPDRASTTTVARSEAIPSGVRRVMSSLPKLIGRNDTRTTYHTNESNKSNATLGATSSQIRISHADVGSNLARVDYLLTDKTGTLTTGHGFSVAFISIAKRMYGSTHKPRTDVAVDQTYRTLPIQRNSKLKSVLKRSVSRIEPSGDDADDGEESGPPSKSFRFDSKIRRDEPQSNTPFELPTPTQSDKDRTSTLSETPMTKTTFNTPESQAPYVPEKNSTLPGTAERRGTRRREGSERSLSRTEARTRAIQFRVSDSPEMRCEFDDSQILRDLRRGGVRSAIIDDFGRSLVLCTSAVVVTPVVTDGLDGFSRERSSTRRSSHFPSGHPQSRHSRFPNIEVGPAPPSQHEELPRRALSPTAVETASANPLQSNASFQGRSELRGNQPRTLYKTFSQSAKIPWQYSSSHQSLAERGRSTKHSLQYRGGSFTSPAIRRYGSSLRDETAQLALAFKLGYSLMARTSTDITIEVNGSFESYFVLFSLAHTTNHPRTLVVIQREGSAEALVLCKGGAVSVLDMVVEQRDPRSRALINLHTASVKHANRLITHGFRTLAMAQKVLEPRDVKALCHQIDRLSTLAAEEKDATMLAIAEFLESGLQLLGVYGVREPLHPGVTKTINTFSQSGIRIWMLTGDEYERAISCAYKAQILKQHMRLLHVNIFSDSDSEVAHIYESFVSELRTLGDMEEIGCVVNGASLDIYMTTLELQTLLLTMLTHSETVIACEMTGSQKGMLTRLLKQGVTPSPLILAVGDGLNDISMFKEAHVSVAIASDVGVTRLTRVNAFSKLHADAYIPSFALLRPLLFEYGRKTLLSATSWMRVSVMIGVLNIIPTLIFSAQSLWSGVLLWGRSGWALYHCLPLGLICLLGAVHNNDIPSVILCNIPILYTATRRRGVFHMGILFMDCVYAALAATFMSLTALEALGSPWILTGVGTTCDYISVWAHLTGVGGQGSLLVWLACHAPGCRGRLFIAVCSLYSAILAVSIFAALVPPLLFNPSLSEQVTMCTESTGNVVRKALLILVFVMGSTVCVISLHRLQLIAFPNIAHRLTVPLIESDSFNAIPARRSSQSQPISGASSPPQVSESRSPSPRSENKELLSDKSQEGKLLSISKEMKRAFNPLVHPHLAGLLPMPREYFLSSFLVGLESGRKIRTTAMIDKLTLRVCGVTKGRLVLPTPRTMHNNISPLGDAWQSLRLALPLTPRAVGYITETSSSCVDERDIRLPAATELVENNSDNFPSLVHVFKLTFKDEQLETDYQVVRRQYVRDHKLSHRLSFLFLCAVALILRIPDLIWGTGHETAVQSVLALLPYGVSVLLYGLTHCGILLHRSFDLILGLFILLMATTQMIADTILYQDGVPSTAIYSVAVFIFFQIPWYHALLYNAIHITVFIVRYGLTVNLAMRVAEGEQTRQQNPVIAERLGGDPVNFRKLFCYLPILLGIEIFTAFAAYRLEFKRRKAFLLNYRAERARKKQTEILNTMLPPFVVNRMLYGPFDENGIPHGLKAEDRGTVSVIFCDVSEFQHLVASLAAADLVKILDRLFLNFDKCAERWRCTKIETVFETYLAAAGIVLDEHTDNMESENPSKDAFDALSCALAMLDISFDTSYGTLMQHSAKTQLMGNLAHGNTTSDSLPIDSDPGATGMPLSGDYLNGLRVQIGIHSGRVISGVVGAKKPQYALFGDTVNTASRMKSTGKPDHIHVSHSTWELLRNDKNLIWEERQIEVKGKGLMTTHLLVGLKVVNHLESRWRRPTSLARSPLTHTHSLGANSELTDHGEGQVGAILDDRKTQWLHQVCPKDVPENMYKSWSKYRRRDIRFNWALLTFRDRSLEDSYKSHFYANPSNVNNIGRAVIIFIATHTLQTLVQTAVPRYGFMWFYEGSTWVATKIRSLITAVAFILWLILHYRYELGFADETGVKMIIFALTALFLIATYVVMLEPTWSINVPDDTKVAWIHIDTLQTFLFITVLHHYSGLLVQYIVVIDLLFCAVTITYIQTVMEPTVLSMEALFVLPLFIVANVFSVFNKEYVDRQSFVIDGEMQEMQKRGSMLLSDMMPEEVLEEFKADNLKLAYHYDEITFIFADLCGFTKWAETVDASEVVNVLQTLFAKFDRDSTRFGVFKVCTIGDAYVAVSKPVTREAAEADDYDPAVGALSVLALAECMIGDIRSVRDRLQIPNLDMRVGLHFGSCVGGVIGSGRLRYDLWGSDVVTGNKMESNGLPGKICVSEPLVVFLMDHYAARFQFVFHQAVPVLGRTVNAYILLSS